MLKASKSLKEYKRDYNRETKMQRRARVDLRYPLFIRLLDRPAELNWGLPRAIIQIATTILSENRGEKFSLP